MASSSIKVRQFQMIDMEEDDKERRIGRKCLVSAKNGRTGSNYPGLGTFLIQFSTLEEGHL